MHDASILAEQFLIKEARHWGIKVHRKFNGNETRLIFAYGMMKSDGELESISPQGLLLASNSLPRKRSSALAAFPFRQDIPMSQARRYICRDIGCKVLNEKEDGSVALVQASVVDLIEGWYADRSPHIIEESNGVTSSGADVGGMGVEPEAVSEFRVMLHKLFGAEANRHPISVCTRQYENPGLVFVGKAEDIHLFLRSQDVRKHLEISKWSQRGYTARDRTASFLCDLCGRLCGLCRRRCEVELGPWAEMIAMYSDPCARTSTTVQPLYQFKREKVLGEDVTETYQTSQS